MCHAKAAVVVLDCCRNAGAHLIPPEPAALQTSATAHHMHGIPVSRDAYMHRKSSRMGQGQLLVAYACQHVCRAGEGYKAMGRTRGSCYRHVFNLVDLVDLQCVLAIFLQACILAACKHLFTMIVPVDGGTCTSLEVRQAWCRISSAQSTQTCMTRCSPQNRLCKWRRMGSRCQTMTFIMASIATSVFWCAPPASMCEKSANTSSCLLPPRAALHCRSSLTHPKVHHRLPPSLAPAC
jgi:hypothetical protein